VTHGPSPKVVGFDLWGNALDVFRQPASYPGTGVLEKFIGGRPAAEGAFNSPYGVTVANGKLFVADTNNQRFQVWDRSTNTFDFSFGRRGFGESNLGFNWPRGAAYAPATDTVWVADTKNFRVSEYTTAGVATGRTFGKRTSLNWTYAVAAHDTFVIVADTVNNRVQMWDPATGTVAWSTDTLGITMQQPRALTVADDPQDPTNRVLYVTDSIGQKLLVLDADTGRLLRTIAPTINGVKAFHRIEGVAVDPRTGNLWVSDSSWNRILKVSADGSTVSVKFGTAGSANNQFQYPANLAIGAVAGRQTLYVADYWNNRVQVFDITHL
jgi:DNA-binding beta-propeller fold protein YncE